MSVPHLRPAIWGPLAILLLLVVRLPSLVEPVGGDQSLYTYIGERILAGGLPYRDAWDQKPPGIHYTYAALWRLWPHASIVNAADLAVAALVAGLLVVLGWRWFSAATGYLAAVLFLLLGNPALQRLGGLRVRSQCETFIALAAAGAILVAARARGRAPALVAAGLLLGAAFWLKYNAIAYAAPVALALTLDRPRRSWRVWFGEVAWVGGAFALLAVAVLAWFAAHGALMDLKLATIDYNLQYSAETYTGRLAMAVYPFVLVGTQAHVDLLWFLAVLGAACLLPRIGDRRVQVALVWAGAAVVSIAINGARGLPQYLVQANPALALVAGAGLLAAFRRRGLAWVAAAVVVAGIWRVGDEPTPLSRPRLDGLPGLVDNLRLDLTYVRGGLDRRDFLGRFSRAGDKVDVLAVDDLAARVRATTRPADRVLVFGFSPGVYVEADRQSASRFFWSRPVVIGFESDRAGYGALGLLQELDRHPPVIVALQKRDWGILSDAHPDMAARDVDSMDFFMHDPRLRPWLDAGYTIDEDTPMFLVWRRKVS